MTIAPLSLYLVNGDVKFHKNCMDIFSKTLLKISLITCDYAHINRYSMCVCVCNVFRFVGKSDLTLMLFVPCTVIILSYQRLLTVRPIAGTKA